MYGKYRRKRFLIFISLIINLNLYCMKKVLLSAVTICCFCAAPAQEAHIPFQSHQALITSVSSNGDWATGSIEGVAYFVNTRTNKLTVFNQLPEISYYTDYVSDCGVAAGSYATSEGEKPCYITEDKGFVPLPTPENMKSGTCLRVSSDGSIAVGSMVVQIEGSDESYNQPVVWYRNKFGEYDMLEDLPYEKFGFDKRINQGVWILGITSDGQKIYGRVIDAFGMVYLPVMWERSSEQSKDWSYKILCKDYSFNKDEICPEWPQYTPVEPDATEYYTKDELAAFNKALELYNDSVEHASFTIPAEERWPYPTYNPNEHEADFFDTSTQEGIERYNKYIVDYNKFNDEAIIYNDSLNLYFERYDKYVINEKRFQIFSMGVSDNGKYMVTNTVNNDIVMINPETEEVSVLKGTEGLFPTAVLNDGTVFMGQVLPMPPLDRVPYVYVDGKVIEFSEWIRARSEKAHNDLMEQFPDGHFGIVNSNNPDGIAFGGFNQNLDYTYTGWVMNLAAYDDFTSGISDAEISGDELSIKYNREAGRIYIAGADNADVRIFAVNGSCVCNASGVSGSLSVPSLVNGAYIVEVKAEGKVLRKKVILQ